MTPREAAKEFIRPYVERGDPLSDLVYGQMGTWNARWRAHIGGYVQQLDGTMRRIGAHQIGVEEVAGVRCFAVFSLDQLYWEIRDETKTGARQASLPI